jgi:hypothetical protein
MEEDERETSGWAERAKSKRTPYKYGGSLGWIASMIDPETSSWKPIRRTKAERPQATRQETGTNDDSSS